MTAATRQAQTQPRLSGEARRQSFLDATAEIIAREGVDGVTMEGVAASLGVSKALPYRYFANGDALVIALFQRETATFDERVADAVGRAADVEGRIRAVIETYLDEVESSSLLVTQFEVSRPDGDPFEVLRRERTVAIVAFIADLFHDEFDLTPQYRITVASILASGSQGVVGVIKELGWDRGRVVDVYVQICLGALRAVARAPER